MKQERQTSQIKQERLKNKRRLTRKRDCQKMLLVEENPTKMQVV